MNPIHYHQFLRAGENTLNFQHAAELFSLVKASGGYSPATWLERYIACMLEPGWDRNRAWKYHDDFAVGITANAMVGGDNCHCGAVVGSLLGAACGVPERFQTGGFEGALSECRTF